MTWIGKVFSLRIKRPWAYQRKENIINATLGVINSENSGNMSSVPLIKFPALIFVFLGYTRY